MMSKFLKLTFCSVVFLTFLGCTCTPKKNDPNIEVSQIELGKITYIANCSSCHNQNPKLQGSTGPAVYGSSLELLTARIMLGTYPENYKPKRESHLMRALPHLSDKIDQIYQFLNSQ